METDSNKQDASDLNKAHVGENVSKPAAARVKRMRGWLGIKSSTHGAVYDDDGGTPTYGDAPSGWNR